MKKITYSLILVATIAFVFSCADDALDPYQLKKVKKGTILVLRGTQLNNIYVKGVPGAELFPKIAAGTEKFDFDAEFLSADPTSLASFDLYVIKKTGLSTDRVLMKNVPFSEFKTTSDYKGPWVSVSMTIGEILTKLGLTATFPLSPADISTLLTTYQFGVNFEIDLNLTDGTQVLASSLVASGLYASNQFYPAQKLNYAMTDYCPFDNTTWAGKTYVSVESPGTTENNKVSIVDLSINRFKMDNWWGDGVDVYFDFAVSSDPSTQTITIPTQTTSEDGVASGTGTYNQCLGTITLNCRYVIGGTYDFLYTLTPQ